MFNISSASKSDHEYGQQLNLLSLKYQNACFGFMELVALQELNVMQYSSLPFQLHMMKCSWKIPHSLKPSSLVYQVELHAVHICQYKQKLEFRAKCAKK